MTRAIDMLLEQHRVVSNISSIALVALVLGMIFVAIQQAFGSPRIETSVDANALPVGLLLGTTLVLSLLSMVLSTFYVVRRRRDLTDWGVFLAIVWIIPYVGISAYLGGANILSFAKHHLA
jgi:uncharacterized membrane protein (DUF485 family)